MPTTRPRRPPRGGGSRPPAHDRGVEDVGVGRHGERVRRGDGGDRGPGVVALGERLGQVALGQHGDRPPGAPTTREERRGPHDPGRVAERRVRPHRHVGRSDRSLTRGIVASAAGVVMAPSNARRGGPPGSLVLAAASAASGAWPGAPVPGPAAGGTGHRGGGSAGATHSTTTAVTMPNMPVSRSTWLRMWQCQTQVPGLSRLTSTE